MRQLHASLERVPKLAPYSVLTVWERMRPGASARPGAGDELRRFVSGTRFFRDQGLIGDGFLGVVLALDVASPAERDRPSRAVDDAVAEVLASPAGRAGITRVRRVGAPWLDSWLEHETGAATLRFFPLFGGFVVLLTIGLYRSWRALAAILASLAVAVLLGVAFAAVVGFGFTIVSSLVPLTLMITATASLVYLHSRFVDQAPGSDLEEHRVRALSNKLLAVSASVFAAAVGFAALAVSQIRPIRQLGIWTAVGLGFGWVVCFTLYPALQVILRAPTRQERPVAGHWVVHVATVLPGWSYRWRWPLRVRRRRAGGRRSRRALRHPRCPRPDAAADRRHRLRRSRPADRARHARFRRQGPRPDLGRRLDHDTARRAARTRRRCARSTICRSGSREDPAVGSVVGLPAVLRLRRYAAGQGDALPADPAELARLTGDLEQLLLEEPALRSVGRHGDHELDLPDGDGAGGRPRRLRGARARGDAGHGSERRAARPRSPPARTGSSAAECCRPRSRPSWCPTLTQSFAITFAVIFVTFLLVFKSGPARLNAMVPSLFAILVMFLLMRVTGIPLNVATILIATTVLGATENDQVHFFYHFQERRSGASTEQALAHSIRVAGHAIVFATVINAGGFLALILSSLPPMRQFGIVTAAAFALALLADFTALPAALWFFFRDRPDSVAATESTPITAATE